MKAFKCFCSKCQSAHDLPMVTEEFRLLMSVSQDPITNDGRMKIACNRCVPFVFSKSEDQK